MSDPAGAIFVTHDEALDRDICGNCGIPVDEHGKRCGEWEPNVSGGGVPYGGPTFASSI